MREQTREYPPNVNVLFPNIIINTAIISYYWNPQLLYFMVVIAITSHQKGDIQKNPQHFSNLPHYELGRCLLLWHITYSTSIIESILI